MPLVIVALQGQDVELLLNTAHIVLAERVLPPVTKVTLSNGLQFTILLPLPELQKLDPA